MVLVYVMILTVRQKWYALDTREFLTLGHNKPVQSVGTS